MLNFQDIYQFLFTITQFFLIALSAKQIGKYATKIKFPLITGYLFAGILSGPFVFNFLTTKTISSMLYLDQISLAFIALIAGAEIYLNEYKDRFKSIRWTTIGVLVFVFGLGTTTLYFISDHIPFMQGLPKSSIMAMSLLAGSILVAISPSSAVAIIKEIRAKGPFTQTVLGVTIIIDILVIVIFSICSSLSDTLIAGIPINPSTILILAGEFILAICLGVIVAKIIEVILKIDIQVRSQFLLVLAAGYSVFLFSDFLKEYSHLHWAHEIFIEPLLINMIAGFYIANFTESRVDFLKILHKYSPIIYLAFFTITGAALEIGIIGKIWKITLTLVLVRIIASFIGSFLGGLIAGQSMKHNSFYWMAFITQAGVGIGLSKEVAREFPTWGVEFSTLMISVIVINQVVGPFAFKWVLFLLKEARPKAKKTDPNIIHKAIIFGRDGQAMALAKQLHLHHWEVVITSSVERDIEHIVGTDIEVENIESISLEELTRLNLHEVGAIVCMLTDEENLEICRIAHQNFPGVHLIVQLDTREYYEEFRKMEALTVLPSTAMISLLDHFVRSPSAVSLLLGLEEDQEVVDVVVKNPILYNRLLKNLYLPNGVLIVSAHRNNKSVPVHGNYCFKEGDIITLLGDIKILEEVMNKFEGTGTYFGF